MTGSTTYEREYDVLEGVRCMRGSTMYEREYDV